MYRIDNFHPSLYQRFILRFVHPGRINKSVIMFSKCCKALHRHTSYYPCAHKNPSRLLTIHSSTTPRYCHSYHKYPVHLPSSILPDVIVARCYFYTSQPPPNHYYLHVYTVLIFFHRMRHISTEFR